MSVYIHVNVDLKRYVYCFLEICLEMFYCQMANCFIISYMMSCVPNFREWNVSVVHVTWQLIMTLNGV